MRLAWGPNLGARVQEITGPDAIPTVTLAAAAGDLFQILVGGAAGTQEGTSPLDGGSTPKACLGGPTLWGSGTAPVSNPVVLTCWGPVGIHSACTWQPPLWMRQPLASGGRDTGVRGALGSPSIHLSIQVLIPCSQHPQAPHTCLSLSLSYSNSDH